MFILIFFQSFIVVFAYTKFDGNILLATCLYSVLKQLLPFLNSVLNISHHLGPPFIPAVVAATSIFQV